uniref:Retrovirus-related Pol polyprotein from transposon TNT 1-94 n=1 Tax=Tanacetum cinerariifolium TaxID=118510 RepID=A0A6L2NCA6_TANCI|nr:retrovirus-related Pol polyprotein from transposon TNT 1-94 [Tanacetum cinerariifolium]
MTFDETPPPSKTSTLVDDDLDEEEEFKITEKKNLENDIEDEIIEIEEIVNIKESRNHPLENVIGNLNQRTLRSQAQNQSNFFCFISTIEPKNVNEALGDENWIVAMQEELNQFIANDVWELLPQPRNMTIIGTKWLFRNKLDENSTVSRNKARLELVRILLGYACALDFELFQMDVKSAFLNGFINEEVYVAQPPRFIDFEKPDHVYKLKKALYGLKQAPKAWPDIMFSVCICARFQDAPKTSHLEAEFAQILNIPCEGARVFTDKWSLDELAYGVHTDGPYQTNPPSPDDIISSIQIDQEGQVHRILREKEIDVLEYQILTREIMPTLKPLEEIMQENIFCLRGNRDHVLACLCYMLYYVVHSEKFNLAYYMAKRMEWVTKQKRLILPYGMLLTRLFKLIMNENHELYNESYVLYDHVMNPLATQQERKTRKEMAQEEVVTLLPPPSLINHLHLISTMMMMMMEITKGPRIQLFVNVSSDEDATTTPSPTTTYSSPTPSNAPSKTPSTNQTLSSQENTSSSFQSKLQISPPSSNKPTSPQLLNPLLDNISHVPPRSSNPQPLQSHTSLDITLSLSPITPLDHIRDTPSPPSPLQPQPPIMDHPLYYNYHDYHGSTCICCSHNRTLFLTLKDEMNNMFAHLEYLLTTAITSHFPPSP